MDQNNQSLQSGEATVLATKSWTAYIGTAMMGFFLFFGFTPIAWNASTGAGLLVLVLSLLFIAYKVMMIRSVQLYVDEVGVWGFSGIFPWSKGVRGVKWRDVDEALYVQGMGSWLFKSYSIRVGHRFTKSSELLMTHMAHGQDAVMSINQQHQELARAGALK